MTDRGGGEAWRMVKIAAERKAEDLAYITSALSKATDILQFVAKTQGIFDYITQKCSYLSKQNVAMTVSRIRLFPNQCFNFLDLSQRNMKLLRNMIKTEHFEMRNKLGQIRNAVVSLPMGSVENQWRAVIGRINSHQMILVNRLARDNSAMKETNDNLLFALERSRKSEKEVQERAQKLMLDAMKTKEHEDEMQRLHLVIKSLEERLSSLRNEIVTLAKKLDDQDQILRNVNQNRREEVSRHEINETKLIRTENENKRLILSLQSVTTTQEKYNKDLAGFRNALHKVAQCRQQQKRIVAGTVLKIKNLLVNSREELQNQVEDTSLSIKGHAYSLIPFIHSAPS